MTSARLVYKGGLSLPDSHMLLDGIAFSALLTCHTTLLQNPLALALESLRGIPLRFLALVNLTDVYYDTKVEPQIVLNIHPDAFHSRVYFNNIFCLQPDSTHSLGVRIALGDTDATNIVVYAKNIGDNQIQLFAARITPPPSSLPRPDDPTPRRPPPILSAKGRDLFPPHHPTATPLKARKNHPAFKIPADPGPTLERGNKDIVKAIVSRNIPPTLLKTHPEYKDIFQWIYRGVCFALRHDLKLRPVDEENASRLAKVHISMYVK